MKNKQIWSWIALAIAALLIAACRQETPPPPTQTSSSESSLPYPTATPQAEPESALGKDEPRPTASEADQAASIRSFAGEANLALEKGETRPGGFVQVYHATLPNDDRVRFDMNVETGEVTGFYRHGQPASSVVIDLEQAQATALAFAEEHYDGFGEAGLESVKAELIDYGDKSLKFYSFWWIKSDPLSGAFLPNEVRIRVNAQTGQVDSYSSLRVQVTVSTQPQIDKQSASDIALGIAQGLEGATVVDATLAVSTLPIYEPGGEQALLWRIVVKGAPEESGYTPGIFVFIHAQSGQVVHVEPFA